MVKPLETITEAATSYYRKETLPQGKDALRTYTILIVAPGEYVLDKAANRMAKLGYHGSSISYTCNKHIMREEVKDGRVNAVVFYEPDSSRDRYDRWKNDLELYMKQSGSQMPPVLTEERKISRYFDRFLKKYAPLRA